MATPPPARLAPLPPATAAAVVAALPPLALAAAPELGAAPRPDQPAPEPEPEPAPGFVRAAHALRETDGEFGAQDGFALLVDGARFLPASLAAPNVTVTALSREVAPQGVPQMTGLAFGSHATCPGFAFRHIYRSPPYDPTTTLTFRVAGLDARTGATVVLGYAQLPAFRDAKEVSCAAEARQPCDAAQSPAWLNEGAFQLPIHLGAPPAHAPFTAAGVCRAPVAPCASLLVRLHNLSDEEEQGAGARAGGEHVTYRITVWTGRQAGAGTDAPVKISLFGPLGGTGPHALEGDDPACDEFQDGSTDTFRLAAPDVGHLRHIRIGHDGEDGWFLRKVLIERQDSGGRWQFPCYRWLDPDKDDLCPYRTLVVRDAVSFADGDAAQRGALPRYLDGIYDSSLCLPHASEEEMYRKLAAHAGGPTFTESLLSSAHANAPAADLAAMLSDGRAVYEALPAAWGEIDDEGDGEPDPDDFGYADEELFDVMQSWVLRRTNIRPLTNVPLLDVRCLRAYNPEQGLSLWVDTTLRLPNEKRPLPLIGRCSLIGADTETETEPLFVARGLDLDSPVIAPEWSDASASRDGVLGDGRSVALIEIVGAWEDDGGAVQTQCVAWAVLPLFLPTAGGHCKYLNSGRFQLPLFHGAQMPPASLVCAIGEAERADIMGEASMARAVKAKELTPLDGASLFVRVVDQQLAPELRPSPASNLDMTQLGIGHSKGKYTAPLASGKAKKRFATLRAKKEPVEAFERRWRRILEDAPV